MASLGYMRQNQHNVVKHGHAQPIIKTLGLQWWQKPLMPALERQRQEEDLCKFKSSLVYKASSRTTRAVT